MTDLETERDRLYALDMYSMREVKDLLQHIRALWAELERLRELVIDPEVYIP